MHPHFCVQALPLGRKKQASFWRGEMRKLANTLGFAKKSSKKALNSGSTATCEFWSQGETSATSIDLFGQEGDASPTTLLVKVTPPQSTDRELGPAIGAYCLLIDLR